MGNPGTNDLSFGGHVDVVFNFLAANIEYSKEVFRPNKSLPESDMIVKHVYRNLRKYFTYPEYMCFPLILKNPRPNHVYPRRMREFWRDILFYSICAAPKDCTDAMEFRGAPFSFGKSNRHREAWLEDREAFRDNSAEENPDYFQHFYFEKAMELRGMELSPMFRRAISMCRTADQQ